MQPLQVPQASGYGNDTGVDISLRSLQDEPCMDGDVESEIDHGRSGGVLERYLPEDHNLKWQVIAYA